MCTEIGQVREPSRRLLFSLIGAVTGPGETQIVSDLNAAAVYLATLLAIVDLVFDVPIGDLFATSSFIALVLAGRSRARCRTSFPYRGRRRASLQAGDLLWVEAGIEGRWRSTQIATGNGNIAVVPNSVFAKARRGSSTTVGRRAVGTIRDGGGMGGRPRRAVGLPP